MPNIPKLSELYLSIKSDLESSYSTVIATFGKSWLNVMASVQAAKFKVYYLLLAKVEKNTFIDTAESESTGGTLERFGRVKLGRNPFPATAGQYSVMVTGSVGSIIPASTTFKANSNTNAADSLFVLDNDYTMTAITGLIVLRSLTPGISARLMVGDQLTVTAPIALVDNEVSVTVEVVEPLEAESLDDYRRKVLESYRLEPQGGAGSDYRVWASDAQSVKQTYPYAISGFPNDINLYIESTIIDSTDGKGTPSQNVLDAVQVAIESPTSDRPSRKPLTVNNINYNPVSVKEIQIDITSYVNINTTKQTAIFESIKTSLSNVRPFIDSIDIVSIKNDSFDINKIVSLILEAVPGSSFGSIIMRVDGNAVTSYEFDNGEIPNLEIINYV